MAILLYPHYIVVFWIWDLPKILLRKYNQVNNYTLSLFSIPLLLKTFFHPLKNEYREGLVVFSRIAGVIVKSFLLIIGCTAMLALLLLEIAFLVLTVTLPVWWFYVLFIK